ncbi:hypothetical protein [Comamonas jiangduensis]
MLDEAIHTTFKFLKKQQILLQGVGFGISSDPSSKEAVAVITNHRAL